MPSAVAGTRAPALIRERNLVSGCLRSVVGTARRRSARSYRSAALLCSRSRPRTVGVAVARYYDPTTAQFLTRDPADAATRSAYGYAGGDPVNASDPSGLDGCGDTNGIGSFLGGVVDCLSKVGRAGGDAVAGAGDFLTLGGTKWVRDHIGLGGRVDECSGWYQAGSDTAFVASMLDGEGEAVAAERAALDLGGLAPKIVRGMERRGWTREQIQEAYDSGERVNAINKANGNPATRYISPTTGQSVVVDNVTGQVIHVGGPGFAYGPDSGDVP